MGRKWRCEQTAGGPRGPPCPFPAVCPCAAVCGGFPARWRPCPSRPPESPCCGLCAACAARAGRTPSRRDEGRMGRRKRCRIKSGGRAAPPARSTPPRNAGRDSGLRGFSPGVNAGVRFEPRGSGLPPRGRNCPPIQDFCGFQAGVQLKIEGMEVVHAQRKNQGSTD